MFLLDRTIGVPKRVLTGLFALMVRSSRTRTVMGNVEVRAGIDQSAGAPSNHLCFASV
jgi:hypothetical protein